MVTIETDSSGNGKRKFSFSNVKKKLKASKKLNNLTDEKSPTPVKKKFSFRKFFRRKEAEPEVEFPSGYGELMLTKKSAAHELSQLQFSCVHNFIDLTKTRKRLRKWKTDFYVDRVI